VAVDAAGVTALVSDVGAAKQMSESLEALGIEVEGAADPRPAVVLRESLRHPD